MSKTLIREVVILTHDGWRPYSAEPEGNVYKRLQCPFAMTGSRNRPYWFVKGDIFLCLGCGRRCSLSRPAGFILPLPINYPQPKQPYTLTPAEMVSRKALLLVKEAAYCLNVSESKVYRYINEGKLNTLKDAPKRVSAADVRKMMEDFEFGA